MKNPSDLKMVAPPNLFDLSPGNQAKLFAYFKNGVLIDSQILALLAVGLSDTRNHTRYLGKMDWNASEYRLFCKFLEMFKIKKFVITPHTFTDFIHKLCERIGKSNATGLLEETKYFLGSPGVCELHIEKNHFFGKKLDYLGVSDWSVSICSKIKEIDCVICKNTKLRDQCQKEGKLSIDFASDLVPFYWTTYKAE
ncbi:MAG: hypothetical protein V1493_04915 [Candidatus Diapherotrites archaeon]